MTKSKKSTGPISTKGKAISSRNSITHGLTSRKWIKEDEKDLYQKALDGFREDFDPKSSIEELLIAKLAECTVRLMRIGEVENALFDLANSESDDLLHAIRSLNVESSEILEERIRDALTTDQWIDKDKFMERFKAFTEMSMQNFSDISGWRFIESKTPKTASYIKELARSEAMSIKDFIEREAGEGNVKIRGIVVHWPEEEEKSITDEELHKDTALIKSKSIIHYLESLRHELAKDLQVLHTVRKVGDRSRQIQNSSMPDEKKLSLIQRYRTADERLFSKTLKELMELRELRLDI